jgi:hypothetical protein
VLLQVSLQTMNHDILVVAACSGTLLQLYTLKYFRSGWDSTSDIQVL